MLTGEHKQRWIFFTSQFHCSAPYNFLGGHFIHPYSSDTAGVLFEECPAQPQNLRQEDGVRVQGRAEAAENLEHVRSEVRELVALRAVLGRERRLRIFGGLRRVAERREKETKSLSILILCYHDNSSG